MNEQKEQYIFVQGKNDFCIIETALIPKHPISCLMDSASSYQLIGTYYKGNLGRVQTPTGNLVKIDDKYYKSIVGDARTIITEDGRIFCNDLDEELWVGRR